MKQLSFIILVLLVFNSCKDKDIIVPNEYLVFGHFYGFCAGEECIELFKVDNERVYEDALDRYPSRTTFYEGNFRDIGKDYWKEAETLYSILPDSLRAAESGTVYGCPDCADSGGFYIEYKNSKDRKFWVIDKVKSQVPTFLHHFMDQCDSAITLINN